MFETALTSLQLLQAHGELSSVEASEVVDKTVQFVAGAGFHLHDGHVVIMTEGCHSVSVIRTCRATCMISIVPTMKVTSERTGFATG